MQMKGRDRMQDSSVAIVNKTDDVMLKQLMKCGEVPGEVPLRVCFVCTGNTCRSPMAAAALNHLGKGNYTAVSAGISAAEGEGISENAEKALERAGILPVPDNDYHRHRSRRINELICADCDRIVAMTKNHLMQLIYMFPQFASKFTVMPKEISDPFMMGQEEYDRCLRSITEGIKELFAV